MSDDFERAHFAFRARIAGCLWWALAEAGKTPEDVAAALRIPLKSLLGILHAEPLCSTSAELTVIAHHLGFTWQFQLVPPPAAVERAATEAGR